VYRKLIRVQVIHGGELNARLHQRGNEREIAGQSVEFGDNQPRLVLLASRQRRRELLPIAPEPAARSAAMSISTAAPAAVSRL
jgi:hypothetical protein